jgi:hypothetical protein
LWSAEPQRTCKKTLKLERSAAQSQINEAAAAANALNAAANAAELLLSNTNKSLNGPSGFLPSATTLINHQDANLTALEQQATKNLADLDADETNLNALILTATKAAESAAQIAADPQIKESLAKFDTDLDTLNEILSNLDDIAKSGNRDAQMIEARLRAALKPATLAKSILMHMLGVAGPAAEVGAAVAK